LDKRDNVTRFFASGFFRESSSPRPLKITLGSFQIFLKNCRDICKSKCKFAAGVNYSGGKNATGINNTGGKFETALMGDSEAWGKLIHEKNLKLKFSWHCFFKFGRVARKPRRSK
jgi:hypothetical protein